MVKKLERKKVKGRLAYLRVYIFLDTTRVKLVNRGSAE